MVKEYKPAVPDKKSIAGSGGADRLPERDGRGARGQRASDARQFLQESTRIERDPDLEKGSQN